jgi:hypothetical protein
MMSGTFKISKGLYDTLKDHTEGYSLGDLGDRLIGTSTGLAFKFISEAMLSPDKPIKVVDHYRGIQADRMLLGMVHSIIEKNELKYFVLRCSDNTVTYEPFCKVKVVTKLEIQG